MAHHPQESAEKKFATITISLVILASPGAAAHGKTRPEVNQEMLEAQQYRLNSSPRPRTQTSTRRSRPRLPA
jgi:hypothetical protein